MRYMPKNTQNIGINAEPDIWTTQAGLLSSFYTLGGVYSTNTREWWRNICLLEFRAHLNKHKCLVWPIYIQSPTETHKRGKFKPADANHTREVVKIAQLKWNPALCLEVEDISLSGWISFNCVWDKTEQKADLVVWKLKCAAGWVQTLVSMEMKSSLLTRFKLAHHVFGVTGHLDGSVVPVSPREANIPF